MILVIADDFSGAAEMAGIAFRYGLKSRVSYDFDPHLDANLLVINTGTRSLPEQDAVAKLRQLAAEIRNMPSKPLIFKKVDSVFRGHIAAEIEVLSNELGYKRAILLPANPSKSRTIENGKYIMNGREIQNTVFAEDPAFPAQSSEVKDLVKSANYGLRHFHLINGEAMPPEGLVTGDLKHNEDFQHFLPDLNSHDLAVGAADFFEQFLLKYTDSSPSGKKCGIQRFFKLIVNGSIVAVADEDKYLASKGFPVYSLPGIFENHEFKLSNKEFLDFCGQLKESLLRHKLVKVSVGQPVSRNHKISQQFLNYLSELACFLVQELGRSQLQLYLTGGETASAILEALQVSSLKVLAEVSPGTVTLEEEQLLVTTKPGSYDWPTDLFNINET